MTRRAVTLRIGLLGMSLLVGFGAAELAARAFVREASAPDFEPDRFVGVKHTPNQRVWVTNEAREFGAWFTTNSFGDPDIERPLTPPERSFRVAVLGDSMVEGAQVDFDRRLTSVMERRLDRICASRGVAKPQIEVMNFGASAFGTAHEWLYYRSHVRRFDPDLVVVVLFPANDIMNNSYRLEVEQAGRPEQRPFFTLSDSGRLSLKDHRFYEISKERYARAQESRRNPSALGLMSERLRLVGLARRGYSRLRRSWGSWGGPKTSQNPSDAERQLSTVLQLYDADLQTRSSAWKEAWVLTDHLLQAFSDEVRRDGAQFHVAILPSSWELHGGDASYGPLAWHWPIPETERRVDRLQIPQVNLLSALQAASRTNTAPLFFPVDGHLTPRGHEIVGNALGDALDSRVGCS